jgi:hypothetical protein
MQVITNRMVRPAAVSDSSPLTVPDVGEGMEHRQGNSVPPRRLLWRLLAPSLLAILGESILLEEEQIR